MELKVDDDDMQLLLWNWIHQTIHLDAANKEKFNKNIYRVVQF